MFRRPDEAQDAVQETFFRAWRKLASYDPEQKFKTWLFAIAHNYSIDRLRGRDKSWLSLESEARSEMTRLLETLPPKYRGPLVLYYYFIYSGLSMAEIAQMLGLTEGAVKTRIFRARAPETAHPRAVTSGFRSTARCGNQRSGGEELWSRRKVRGTPACPTTRRRARRITGSERSSSWS